MWLSQVTLRNFRPFYYDGKAPFTLVFEKASASKFTIVEAKSDVGKTTLLSAIAWCLYGREDPGLGSREDFDGKSVGPFSTAKLREMKDGDVASVEVGVILNDSRTNQPLYEINRNQMFERAEDGEYPRAHPRQDSQLTISRWEGSDMVAIPSQQAQMAINSILPEDIHLFFLFEGEKLEKHFAFNNTENIASAIEKTSQVKQLRNAIDHLRTVHDGVWTSGEGRVAEEVVAKRHEIEELQLRIDDARKSLDDNKAKLDEITGELRGLGNYLEKHNAAAVKDRAIRQRQLEEENQEIEERIKALRSDYKERALKYAPLAMLSSPLSVLRERLVEEMEKDELEPNIDNQYLEEILKQKKCVCGRSLDPKKHVDVDCITLINKKRDQNKLNDIKEFGRNGRYQIEAIFSDLQTRFGEGLSDLGKRVDEEEKKHVGNVLEIDRISSEQKGFDDREVSKMQSQRDSMSSARDEQIRAIGRQETFIKVKESEIAQKRTELERLARKQEGSEAKKRQADFLARAINHLESIEGEILSEVRKRVEERTWEYFKTLHWEKTRYKSFTIDENYELRLQDIDGINWINDLASGPKQLLLLSFIAALSEVSGFKFPVFVDTPLANIDNEQRDNVAKMYPDYLKNTQVILLMKDQEYTPRISSLLSRRVWKEFRMERSESITRLR